MVDPHPLITVIIPIRNRSGRRLINCLKSLRYQIIDELTTIQSKSAIEIIICDFGSNPNHRKNIAKLAESERSTVIFVETNTIWNRSLALNIGIRRARGKYVLCTDADMVFLPNFIQSALDAQRKYAETGAMVLCQCHDLPEYTKEFHLSIETLSNHLNKSTIRQYGGTGACQCAPLSFFNYARGYDEGYVFWGSEDKDMVARAEKYGLKLVWVDNLTAMAHQWHRSLREDRKWLVMRNRIRYKLTRHKVVKNPRHWGGKSSKIVRNNIK